MKEKETEYLNKLFTSSSDANDEVEAQVPLVDVPEGLSEKLYAVSEPKLIVAAPVTFGFFEGWPKMTSIAATLVVAVMGFQFYQQQQTLNQLEQAQADLATALHYLGQANRITREQVRSSLNENINGARVRSAMEETLDDAFPDNKHFEPETDTQSRTL